MSKVRILVCGNPYHVEVVKQLIGNIENIKVVESSYLYSNDVDVFYWIYGFPSFLAKKISFWINNKPLLIVHWIGTDVMSLISPHTPLETFNKLITKTVEKIKYDKIINLAGSPWLKMELKSQGINAYHFPLTTLDIKKLKRPYVTQKDIDVLTYLPKSRFQFYGGNHILKLAKELPQFTFVVIMPDILDARKLPKSSLPNLKFHARMSFDEMQNMYSRSKCFLRLTEHDGLSLSVLEALYYKLQVIWSYNFPHVIHVERDNLDKLKNVLICVLNDYHLNEEGHKYVISNFSTDNVKERYRKLFLLLLSKIK
jgi:glycosyltransferase involved in cell wall biosynthesis